MYHKSLHSSLVSTSVLWKFGEDVSLSWVLTTLVTLTKSSFWGTLTLQENCPHRHHHHHHYIHLSTAIIAITSPDTMAITITNTKTTTPQGLL